MPMIGVVRACRRSSCFTLYDNGRRHVCDKGLRVAAMKDYRRGLLIEKNFNASFSKKRNGDLIKVEKLGRARHFLPVGAKRRASRPLSQAAE